MIPTQFFFSVYIEGQFKTIENDNEKRRKILYELVKKYEKDNDSLSIDNNIFNYAQKNLFIGIIKINNLTAKAKFGQNMSETNINIIINDLKNRNTEIDNQTIYMIDKMKKYT